MTPIASNCTDLLARLEEQSRGQRYVHEVYRNIDMHISAKYKRKLADTHDLIIIVKEKMHTSTYTN